MLEYRLDKKLGENEMVCKKNVEIIALLNDFILFTFLLEEDMNGVLENGRWFFGKKGLFLKRWTRGFRIEKENIYMALV